jgi:large subunit ribosomal protein L15
MLTLKTVQPKARKYSRRVGRGNGSGRGTYSGRGIKGQRARSGSRYGLKLRGLRTLFKAIPKNKGFVSPYAEAKLPTISLTELERRCGANTTVEVRDVKVLGTGELTKALTVKAGGFSASAKAKIEAAGGKAITCGKR